MGGHRLRLPCEAASAGRARALVGEVYAAEGVDDQTADIARLVVSELVTNAVVHGCSEVELDLWVGPRVVGGVVSDYGTGTPTLLESPLSATGGRGLGIVAATTSTWGVRVHGHGKTVWFELPRPAPTAAADEAEPATLEDLPAELKSRVMAATAHAQCRVVQRRAARDAAGEEYEIYALAGDRCIHMVLSLRPEGSVAETTETFLADQIRRVVTIDPDRAALEVESGPDRRWAGVPAEIGRALGRISTAW